MATRTIASLLVDLVARTSKFRGGLRDASRSTRRFSDNVQQSSATVQRYARTLIAVATTGALAIWIKRSLEAADATAKTSDKLGIATERLVGLRHAAEQTAGVTSSTLDTALQRMVRRVSEAANGTGEARKALAELGVDAQHLATLSPDQQFAAIADAMQGVATQGDRVRLAMRLFDTEGVSLVNTLRVGSEGLEQFQTEAEALGIALNRVDAAKVEAANDAMDRVGKLVTGVGQRLAIDLAPFLEAAAETIVDLAVESDGFKEAIGGAIESGINGFKFLVTVVFRVRQGFNLLGAGALKAFELIVRGITNADRGFRSMGRFIENLGELIAADFRRIVADLALLWKGLRLVVARFVQFAAVQFADLLVDVGRSINRLKGGLGLALQSAGQSIRAEFGDLGARALNDFETAAVDARQATVDLNEAAENLFHVNVEPNQRLAALGDELGADADRLVDNALELERKRLDFLGEVDRVVGEIQAKSQEAAERAAAASPAAQGDPTAGILPPDQENPERLQERLQQRLQILRDFGVAEREQISLDFQLKTEQLRSALENDLLTKEEFALAEQDLARQREEALTKISKQGNRARFQDAQTAAGSALALAEAFGDQAIGLQKALSLTESGIAIATGIAKAQALGFPANIAEALRVAAVGVKVANTIRSANRGTPGFSTPTVRSGASANGGAGPDADPTTQLAADRIERDAPGKLVIPDGAVLDARQLAERVNEAGRQGFVFDGIQLGGATA